MQSVLMFLAGLSGLALIVALIKPTLFSKNFTRKKALLFLGGGWLFLSVLASSLNGGSQPQSDAKKSVATAATSTGKTEEPKTVQDDKQAQQDEATKKAEADKAEKELTDFMHLAIKGGLVSSYEFSDTANEVFVGSPWYNMTVQDKKDFMAYIAMRKKIVRGYAFFTVKDAYSNEKVGEVTSFSNSLEVYR